MLCIFFKNVLYLKHHYSFCLFFMSEVKKNSKRSVRSRDVDHASDGSSSAPEGLGSFSVCGHSGCNRSCNVRYVGPVSHIRDHHVLHAARGVTHVWSAAVVSGLAVVLTGAIAYSGVEARTAKVNENMLRASATREDMVRIMNRLEVLEKQIRISCGQEGSLGLGSSSVSASSSASIVK